MGLLIKDLIASGEKILKNTNIENPGFDAEELLGFVIGFDRQKLFMNRACAVDDFHSEKYFSFINRRANGEPLQYITGEQYFMSWRFSVDPSVLIIRPETEILAEKAIEYLRAHESAKNVLDLGTGSGALAVSIAKSFPDIKITASDISEKALNTAKKNAGELGISGQIEFIKSDLFNEIKQEIAGRKFDLLVTNPPYIRTDAIENLQREIRDHEPLIALDGGTDGLDFYRRIASEAGDYLRPDACILMEIGYDQADAIIDLFAAAGLKDAKVFQDLTGLDRVAEFTL